MPSFKWNQIVQNHELNWRSRYEKPFYKKIIANNEAIMQNASQFVEISMEISHKYHHSTCFQLNPFVGIWLEMAFRYRFTEISSWFSITSSFSTENTVRMVSFLWVFNAIVLRIWDDTANGRVTGLSYAFLLTVFQCCLRPFRPLLRAYSVILK